MLPDPWLRGARPDVHALVAPVLFSFQQAREDLENCAKDLSIEQLWQRPANAASVGFHIRHTGGSVERLMTYVQGKQITEAQLEDLKHELDGGATAAELFAQLEGRLSAAEKVITELDPATLTEARGVGRKQLPTTVIGLLVHIAEHTQRHVGQAITTAKIVRGLA